MTRLLTVALAATLAMPVTAVAQTRGHRPPPPASISPFGLPQAGVPLPRIGLPLPRSGLINTGTRYIVPFHDGEIPGSAFARARNLGTGFSSRIGRSSYGIGSSYVGMPVVVYVPQYVVPQYVVPIGPVSGEPARAQIETQLVTGSLILQMQPSTAQVFVDGYYVGMPEDFDGRRGELSLEPGVHKIEVMAPGYENVILDMRIAASQTIRYQNAMKPAAAAAPQPLVAPAAPIAPKTIYLIPGCYLGDVPPKDAHLPATCDVNRVVAYTH
jgi:hypothetical protein